MADPKRLRRRWRDSDILLLILNPILLVIVAIYFWGLAALVVAGLILAGLAMAAMIFIVAAPSKVGGHEPDESETS